MEDCHTLPPIFSRNNFYDFKLAMHHAICPAYRIVSDDLRRGRKYRELQEPYIKELKHTFEKWVDKRLDNHEILNMCRYFTIAYYHEMELKFNFTKDENKACMGLVDTEMFFRVWGNDLLWKIGSKRYLEHLLDAMDRIINKTQSEKLEINLTHDMILAMILNGLGYEMKATPPFAATLIFELRHDHKEDEYYVYTYYNDEPITFDMCKEHPCKYKTFNRNIRERILPGNIYQLCGDDEKLKKIEDIMSHYEVLELPTNYFQM